ncbi:MAG: sodium:calcium antiporter, partial [bacterium]|nr:sodium:calcium antiporter [bacterium]
MLVSVLLFIAGFVILLKGADLLIDGATVIAKSLRVSPFLIGLLIAGIGTSLPELAITLTSHLAGGGDVGLGTLMGSNTFNILAILGLSAVLVPLSFKKQWVDRDLVWNFVAIVAVGFFALADGIISRFEGGVL